MMSRLVCLLVAGLSATAQFAPPATGQVLLAQTETDDFLIDQEDDPAQIAFFDTVGLASDLGHIESQLRIARELGGANAETANHIAKVRGALYPLIEPELAERSIPPFGDALEVSPEEMNLDALIERVAAIRASLDRGPDPLLFTVTAGGRLMYTAAEQYDYTFPDGGPVDAFYYRGARAAAALARSWFDAVKADYAARDAEAAERTQEALDYIATAFPTPDAPATPVVYPGDFNAMAYAISTLGERLLPAETDDGG